MFETRSGYGLVPLFLSSFTSLNSASTTPGSAAFAPSPGGAPPAKFDLTLSLRVVQGRIVGSVNYAAALFERETIERYLGYLRQALTAMVADCRQSVAAVPLLSGTERQRLL